MWAESHFTRAPEVSPTAYSLGSVRFEEHDDFDETDAESPQQSTRPQQPQQPQQPQRQAAYPTLRLPRHGPLQGGGRIVSAKKHVVDTFKALHEQEEHLIDFGIPSDLGDNSPASRLGSASWDARSSRHAGSRMATESAVAEARPVLRTRADRDSTVLSAVQSKIDMQREEDRRGIVERVERGKQRRHERSVRLLDMVMGQSALAAETGLTIRGREEHCEVRRRKMHAEWENKVFAPLIGQAGDHIDAQLLCARRHAQGNKKVTIVAPGRRRLRLARIGADPCKQSLETKAAEDEFHRHASAVLHGSQSGPELRAGRVVPSAKSRLVLEPMDWSQPQQEATVSGLVARAVEHGPHFRQRRGGNGAHSPAEADGQPAAGKRSLRLGKSISHGHLGILEGRIALEGESSQYKTPKGGCSGAPLQDHYAPEGPDAADNLFPRGRRVYRVSSDSALPVPL